MKIRIKGNTLRLRLSKSEVDAFAATGYIEERTEFVDDVFIYAMQNSDTKRLLAELTNNHLTVLVPRALSQRWVTTNEVGFEDTMPLPNGKELYILIEKDFKCIDADVSEDQSDYFENPVKAC